MANSKLVAALLLGVVAAVAARELQQATVKASVALDSLPKQLQDLNARCVRASFVLGAWTKLNQLGRPQPSLAAQMAHRARVQLMERRQAAEPGWRPRHVALLAAAAQHGGGSRR
jgi:hypothetical protein